ncbi:acetyltransferase [Purpureocillium lavendulum]|uniref:Acetyltransferase n=1 Tax=Purpureocillium lavendulum TaxID=1247861 RepID=A0AB34FZV3_9HYPO|nr:acetyltransferase [Purpureocillium lavendulum]
MDPVVAVQPVETAPPGLVVEAARVTSLIPPRWHDTVRQLAMKERDEAGLSLAHAFAADPLSVYLLAGDGAKGWPPERVWKLHVSIMRYTFAAYRLRGVATAIGPDYDAIALWTPPGKFNDDWWATLWSGTWRLWYQLPPEAKNRFFAELVPALHDAREQVMGKRNDDCWYLGYIGTKPNSRGRGYASKLISSMADRADAENRPIYLESSSLANNKLYAKFGFEIKSEIVLTRGPKPVYLYCMVREPQPSLLQQSVTESSTEGIKA